MTIIEQVREALKTITHRTGELEVPAVVSADTMRGLWETATAALAALEACEVVEGWARVHGDKRTHTVMPQKPVNPISDNDRPAILLLPASEEPKEKIWHWCCETHGDFYAPEHQCPKCEEPTT